MTCKFCNSELNSAQTTCPHCNQAVASTGEMDIDAATIAANATESADATPTQTASVYPSRYAKTQWMFVFLAGIAGVGCYVWGLAIPGVLILIAAALAMPPIIERTPQIGALLRLLSIVGLLAIATVLGFALNDYYAQQNASSHSSVAFAYTKTAS